MSDCVPEIVQVEPPRPEHLVLEPVPLLMPDERRLVDALGQDEDAQRRQRDAAEAGGTQEPADDVGRGAGGHGQPLAERDISIHSVAGKYMTNESY